MIILRIACYIILLSGYAVLTKDIFLNIYRKLRRFSLRNRTRSSLQTYQFVGHHWFYKNIVEGRLIWKPFSIIDSIALETVFLSDSLENVTSETVVATDGGRFDVCILNRTRSPVYWSSNPTEVRRCSWFHRRTNQRYFTPFKEYISNLLEEEYKEAFETNTWHRIIQLPNEDAIELCDPETFVLFNDGKECKSRVIKRGLEEFAIDFGEPEIVDHLLLVVHGIGSACDLKFHSVEEVVDRLRSVALQLLKSHRHVISSQDNHKIEVLPISWHSILHSENTKIDRILKNITLNSLPWLRNFTNDTLLDILLYTSPIYYKETGDCKCAFNSDVSYTTKVPFAQIILDAVGKEINRIYNLFISRNPMFKGGTSLIGHSLGSVIIFDLLCHQNHYSRDTDNDTSTSKERDESETNPINFMMFEAETGKPLLHYPELVFEPTAFFALGSPIGMFLTVRGLNKLGNDFSLPTCSSFFNIFHPYDPIAYRIESLINPYLENLKPILIQHYKGRKRIHLEVKETVIKVGTNVKQKFSFFMTSLWKIFLQLLLPLSPPVPRNAIAATSTETLFDESSEVKLEDNTFENLQQYYSFGLLNRGRRVDYVLQETAFEYLNEYIFALTSHVCYWNSEDTILLILEEIYSTLKRSSSREISAQTCPTELYCLHKCRSVRYDVTV